MVKCGREDFAVRDIHSVGLAGFENSYPHELSGGMRKRAGLARALAVDSGVLLMDEPFSTVVEQTRRKFQEDLLGLVGNETKTFLFVTDSIDEAVYVIGQTALLLPRSSRVFEIIRPSVLRDKDLDNIRRGPEYLDIAGRIRAALKSYVEPEMTLFGIRLPAMSSLLIWGLLWDIIGRLERTIFVLPRSEVPATLFKIAGTPAFQNALCKTAHAFCAGVLVAVLIGMPTGVLMSKSRLQDELLLPWADIFLSARLTALVPVLMVLFGFGMKSIINTTMLFAVWITILNARGRHADQPHAGGDGTQLWRASCLRSCGAFWRNTLMRPAVTAGRAAACHTVRNSVCSAGTGSRDRATKTRGQLRGFRWASRQC